MSYDEEIVTPISGRMAELRGPELTVVQRQAIECFATKTPPLGVSGSSSDFDLVFDPLSKIAEKEPLTFESIGVARTSSRTRKGREIRGLENQITPVAKWAAIESYRPVRKPFSNTLVGTGGLRILVVLLDICATRARWLGLTLRAGRATELPAQSGNGCTTSTGIKAGADGQRRRAPETD